MINQKQKVKSKPLGSGASSSEIRNPPLGAGASSSEIRNPPLGPGASSSEIRNPPLGPGASSSEIRNPPLGPGAPSSEIRNPPLGAGASSSEIRNPPLGPGASSSEIRNPPLGPGASSSEIRNPPLGPGAPSSEIRNPPLGAGASSSEIRNPPLGPGASSSEIRNPPLGPGASSSAIRNPPLGPGAPSGDVELRSAFRVHIPRHRRAAAPAASAAATQAGTTAHFVVSFDSSLGSTGQAVAEAVLSVCERDFAILQENFGGITPSNLPFRVSVIPGNNGASHPSCSDTNISIEANSGPISFMSSLVVAEADEVFMANFGHGWDCGASNGEGLSRVLANDIYPNVEPSDFVSSSVWLDTPGRPNFVDRTDPTDQNYVSIGCAVLFLNWLRYELNFSWQEIIAAGAGTLGKTYTNLTQRTDGFDQFAALLQARFPAGTPSGLTTDNPFRGLAINAVNLLLI
jgi:hypothetical protein